MPIRTIRTKYVQYVFDVTHIDVMVMTPYGFAWVSIPNDEVKSMYGTIIGSSTSKKKSRSSRANGKKGGRPKKGEKK